MFIGINAHPVHGDFEPCDLRRFDFARYPVWADLGVRNYQRKTKAFLEFGVRPILVMDHRSLLGAPDFDTALERAAKRYPKVEYWQLGNEPDQGGEGAESSSTLTVDKARQLLEAGERVFRPLGKTILSPGFVSANGPDYLRKLDYYPFDILALHFYGLFPWRKGAEWRGRGFGDIRDGIERYRAVLPDKRIFITEFGIERSYMNSDVERQDYFVAMLGEMEACGVEAALPYCHGQEQCGELALKDLVRI